jgi:hypothetical protein
MTQNYIAGELSLLLGQLRSLSGSEQAVGQAAALRNEAETSPVYALRPVAARAVEFAESLCWESLEEGDVSAFHRRAEALVDLYEFAVCSRLLPEASVPIPPEGARSGLRPRR